MSLKILKGKKSSGKRVLKLYTDEDSDLSKNWLPEKVVEMSKDKLWKNCEILYWIPVARKDKIQVKSRSDRYLFVFYNAEQSDGFLLNISCREKDVEFKKSWPLSDIKSVEFQENSTIFKISLEHDYTWTTTSNIERDEAIWVIIHICKYLCSNEIKVKSTMGIKLLGLALTTNKTLSNFSLLRKLLDENMDTEYRDLLGNDLLTFTPEETDAENLFDELHWGSSDSEGGNGDPAQLQKCLHDETGTLFVEICDFLLQWEEDDEKEAIIKGYTGRDTDTSKNSNASVRETFELLSSLDSVDASLENVNDWLSEQVEYLSGVQSQLFQIESENSGLETSWHNLTAVKAMITSLLRGPLSLDESHEEILRHPQKILHIALHEEKTLQNTSRVIAPLVEAITALRNGLESIEGKNCDFTPVQWRHIQSMTMITEHRQKLRQLTSDVCTELVDISQSLFKVLVQHKALNDEKYGGKPIRRFSFTTIVNSVKVAQGNFKVLNTEEVHSGDQEKEIVTSSSHSDDNPPDSTSTAERLPEVTYSSSSKSLESDNVVNQIASSQRDYHHAIYPFFTLMENLSELSPSLQENLKESYITYTEKHLFSPLFKDMFREIIDLLPSHQTKELVLSNMPKSMARKMTAPSLRFQHPSICRSGTPLVVSPWTILSSVVRLGDEVIQKEHKFLCRTILKLEKNKYGLQTEEKKGSAALSRLFHTFKEKLMKLVSSTDYTEGVEIFAMLVSVNMMLSNRTSSFRTVESDNLSIWGISMEEFDPEWDFMEEMLMECKEVLSLRLDDFVASQLAAFREKKIDLKKTGVFSPISRFPAFIDQLMVFSGSKNFDFIDDALEDISAELLIWVQSVAAKNEKYCDVILIHNLEYLVESLSVRPEVTALNSVSVQAQQDKEAAEKRYVKWMISYELPKYANLAERIIDLGRRATSDQLGLYIRREDVSKAVSKMDKKHVEQAITAIRKRLDKHFHASADVAGLFTLVPKLWELLRAELSNVFSVIERVANECYQINLIVDEAFVAEFSKKIT
mmetsp:Transcript_472/g.832  ORF Transcript_472/g.832 Transcript_472/m.832 type:complete len:1029 (-) Transcript_472:383-3469(-)